MNTTKRSIGFYLGIVVAAFCIAGFVLNGVVSRSSGIVSILLIVAAVIEFAAVILILVTGTKPIYNTLSIVSTFLIAYALVQSFVPQMDQLGNIYAGLDKADTLQNFFTFVGVTDVGLVLSIVSSFLGKVKFI